MGGGAGSTARSVSCTRRLVAVPHCRPAAGLRAVLPAVVEEQPPPQTKPEPKLRAVRAHVDVAAQWLRRPGSRPAAVVRCAGLATPPQHFC